MSQRKHLFGFYNGVLPLLRKCFVIELQIIIYNIGYTVWVCCTMSVFIEFILVYGKCMIDVELSPVVWVLSYIYITQYNKCINGVIMNICK